MRMLARHLRHTDGASKDQRYHTKCNKWVASFRLVTEDPTCSYCSDGMLGRRPPSPKRTGNQCAFSFCRNEATVNGMCLGCARSVGHRRKQFKNLFDHPPEER